MFSPNAFSLLLPMRRRIIRQIRTHRKMAWVTVMMKLCIAGCIDPEETVEVNRLTCVCFGSL
jgi:hypothetical protein